MMVIGGRTHRLMKTDVGDKSSDAFRAEASRHAGGARGALAKSDSQARNAYAARAGGPYRKRHSTPVVYTCAHDATHTEHMDIELDCKAASLHPVVPDVRPDQNVDCALEPDKQPDCSSSEHDDEVAEKDVSMAFITKQVLICLLYYALLAVFCIMGALATQAFELPAEIQARHSEDKLEMQIYHYILNHTTWEHNGSEIEIFLSLFAHYQEALKHTVKCGYDNNQTLWSFLNSVFYTATIVTTIGYGHLAPKTSGGRIAMIVIAIFGIPLFLLNVTQVGRVFIDVLKIVKRRIRKCRNGRTAETDDSEGLQVPFYLCIVIISVFIMLFSSLLIIIEEWDLLEAVYFTFGTLATIGLGDVMPMNVGLLIGFSIFLIIGLSLVTMFLELTEFKMQQCFIRLKSTTRVAVELGLQYRRDREAAMLQWSKIAEMITRIEPPKAADEFKQFKQAYLGRPSVKKPKEFNQHNSLKFTALNDGSKTDQLDRIHESEDENSL